MAAIDERTVKVHHPVDGDVTLVLEYPSSKAVREGFDKYHEMAKAADNGESEVAMLDRVKDYTAHVESMMSRGTGKPREWFDELSDEDTNKIQSWYDQRVKRRWDFMMSSVKQSSSAEENSPASSTPSQSPVDPGTNTEAP